MKIVTFNNWESWNYSDLIDERNGLQLVFRCPMCGALVGDPEVHQSWHLNNMKGM